MIYTIVYILTNINRSGGKVNEVAVKTRKEAEECINLGMKARSVASTALNGDSSRSLSLSLSLSSSSSSSSL